MTNYTSTPYDYVREVRYLGLDMVQQDYVRADGDLSTLDVGRVYQARLVSIHNDYTLVHLWGIDGSYNSVGFATLDGTCLSGVSLEDCWQDMDGEG